MQQLPEAVIFYEQLTQSQLVLLNELLEKEYEDVAEPAAFGAGA